MKVRINTEYQLPKKDWDKKVHGADKALLISNLKTSNNSKLSAKLLVFKNNKDLVDFWKRGLNRFDLCKHTLGAVTKLGYEMFKVNKDGSDSNHSLVVDKNFFCVIGLTLKGLTCEVICHEAVHAAYAYSKRTKHKNLWMGEDGITEEEICYPTGRIASAIVDVCDKAGLFELRKQYLEKGKL